MKRKKLVGLMGAIALTLGVSSNLQYAMNDYDVASNSLHVEVLAQTASGSGGGGGSSVEENHYAKVAIDCKYEGWAQPYSTVELRPGIYAFADCTGHWTFKVYGGKIGCYNGGGSVCTPAYCPTYIGQGETT